MPQRALAAIQQCAREGLDHGIGHWASMSPQNNE
jgi:hypothetical protein